MRIPMTPADREHEIVVFGATGFTGALTAEYLAEHADEGTRWAIAGRNSSKLEQLRERLGAGGGDAPIVEADVSDRDSMRRLAQSAGVVISTVGPYIEYGEPLV